MNNKEKIHDGNLSNRVMNNTAKGYGYRPNLVMYSKGKCDDGKQSNLEIYSIKGKIL